MVLRLDEDLVLVDALDPVEEAWLVAVCVLVSDCDAAAADSKLYCDGSVTTEGAMKENVENAPSASDTRLARVMDSVVNAVGAESEVITFVAGAVTDVEIRAGSSVVFRDTWADKSEASSTVSVLLPMILIPPAYCDKWAR
jgi:hypothetical protein